MTRSRCRVVLSAAAVCAVAAALPRTARAQADSSPIAHEESILPTESTLPPAIGNPFLQYGVAFTTEIVASSGAMCSSAPSPCVLGSGGGVAARIGRRSAGPWYLGLAYETSKQDANTIYPLAILQQFRAEGRYYFLSGRVLNPFIAASAGMAAYGNEWLIDTFGPAGSATLGIEAQLSRETVVGLALNYRLVYFRSFVDSANITRPDSGAQLLGLDLQLEVRDPF